MSRGLDEERLKQEMSAAVTALDAWRRAHPTATFDEIEATVDEQMARLHERVLTELVHASPRADVTRSETRPVCPTCGGKLQVKGRPRRRLTTHTGESIELERTYTHCPRCNAGFFPPG